MYVLVRVLTMVTRLPNHWCASSWPTTSATHWRVDALLLAASMSSAVSRYVTRPQFSIAPAHTHAIAHAYKQAHTYTPLAATCSTLHMFMLRHLQGWRDIYQVIDITDIYLISIWFLLSKKSTLISWFLVLYGTSVWQCGSALLRCRLFICALIQNLLSVSTVLKCQVDRNWMQ